MTATAAEDHGTAQRGRPTAELELNAFRVEPQPGVFSAYSEPFSGVPDLSELRDRLHGKWVVWRSGATVLGLPLSEGADGFDGSPVQMRWTEQLSFGAYLVNQNLERNIPRYTSFRRDRFTFLGQRREFVREISARMRSLPPVASQFAIRPRYALEARVIETADGEPFVGLAVKMDTGWAITAPLPELAAAGVPLAGLDVVRRDAAPGQRRLVGRIGELSGGMVALAESLHGARAVPAADVAVEGSRAAFAACLRALLGSRYERFERERQLLEAELLDGPGWERMLDEMETFLRSASPMRLGAGLECVIGPRVRIGDGGEGHRSLVQARQVDYCFDPARTKRGRWAWQGLERFGPFSRDTFAARSPRILVVFPDTAQGSVEAFLRALRDGVPGQSGYPAGFARTFGLVNLEFALQPVPWLAAGRDAPHGLYRAAIERVLSSGERFDSALVVLLDEHADLPDPVNPYLHTKAMLLMAGIPSQELRLATIRKPAAALAYSLRNIAVALYAKMGGIPWTVDQDLAISDEIVIGLGTAELSASRYHQRQRYAGITTVFRGDGNYLLGTVSRVCAWEDYPAALRESLIDVLREVKDRNGWRPGDTVRVVCHTARPVRNAHVDQIMAECVAEVGADQEIEFAFLTVSDEHPFILLDPDQPGLAGRAGQSKGRMVAERGVIAQVGRYQRLLAVTGPRLVKRAQAPLPHPLLVRLHSNSTFRDLTYLTEQALKFTSLSWRSTLPTHLPVTIYYSKLIAELLARLDALADWSPAMLNTRLKFSRWFL